MEDIIMKRYIWRIFFGLLMLLSFGLLGFACNGGKTSDHKISWPPDTILAVTMSETYTVTAPPDTTPGEMSLYTNYDPEDTTATWPPDTIMFIQAPPDTTP
jgi:hypothetical protein